jgi:hypothetical protein
VLNDSSNLLLNNRRDLLLDNSSDLLFDYTSDLLLNDGGDTLVDNVHDPMLHDTLNFPTHYLTYLLLYRPRHFLPNGIYDFALYGDLQSLLHGVA